MRTGHLPLTILAAGMLSIAVGGCGNSGGGSTATGGSTSGVAGSTSVPAGGSSGGNGVSGGTATSPAAGATSAGGIVGTGGSGSGGIVGTGGSGGGVVGTGGIGPGGAGSGGIVGTGGTKATGGTQATGTTGTGGRGTGGSGAGGTAGTTSPGTGGKVTVDAGSSDGPAGTGGATGTGGRGVAGATGTAGNSGTGGSTGGGAGSTGSGTCTASKSSGTASGTGTHKVTIETNSDPGISEGTIYRPTDLGGSEKYPIFAWGEGGCSENGSSNSVAMGEIASHGYFVIADGTPGSSASRSQTSDTVGMGKPLLAYIAWAIAENGKSCSAYYQSLDTTKVATNGFSCGGLMAEGTAGDSRITTWGLNSSGLFSADQALYKTIHTPVLIVLGGSTDMAYTNGERDYTNISALGIPIMLFSKAGAGHGGDLFSTHGGDFTKIDLAWLNWWLKGDETATGKGLLVGSGCSYCTNTTTWEVKSANLP